MEKIILIWVSFNLWRAEKWRNHKARPQALKKAIRKAKRLQRRKLRLYRVYFLQNRYQALNRDDVKRKKRAGEFNQNINVTKMKPLCFYNTLNGVSDFAQELLNSK